MSKAFFNSDFGSSLVLEAGNGEGKRGVFVVYLGEELSGALNLETILSVQLSLVDSSSVITFFRLSLAG